MRPHKTGAPGAAIRAAATLAAAILSFLALYALCRHVGATANPAIFAAVLALALARRERTPTPARILATLATLAGVALAVAAVALLLRANLALGAALYSAAMSVSIWLRNFGPRARAAGGLIALPLVAMLIAPGGAAAPGGALVDIGLAIGAAVAALASVTLVAWLAARFGFTLGVAQAARVESGPATPGRAGMTPQTRMATQMAVALLAAFSCGGALFPAHWSWVVVSAFIVCSGARGRGDAAYKGVLRLGGAIGGTLAVTASTFVWRPQGPAEAVVAFAVLYFGLWLREFSYAYWAGAMTIILALLAPGTGESSIALLGARLAAIFAGALCAVAAAWFVFPIRTEAVVRRRIADALRALDELVAHGHQDEAQAHAKRAAFEWHLAQLETLAPPVRWHRWIFRSRGQPEHPARWVDLVMEVAAHARTLRADAGRRAIVRRAIGVARRSLASHGKSDASESGLSVSASLHALRGTLAPRDNGDAGEAQAGAASAADCSGRSAERANSDAPISSSAPQNHGAPTSG